MAESKEYISRPDEMGNIHISEDVLAVIAAAAALEVEGVGSLANNFSGDIADLLGKKSISRGVRVVTEGESVVVEMSILIRYGSAILDVCKSVQDAVAAAVEATAGLTVSAVNVHVGGVVIETEQKNPQA